MKRLLSRNAKLSLGALPIAIGCALAQTGDPPDPVLNPVSGAGGEEETGGSGTTGGASTGGTGVSGASGSSSGTSGASTTGGAGGMATGGASGTGGAATTGGSAGKGGTTTGGTAGTATTGGTAGKGGTAGTATGGTGGATTGGTAGKGAGGKGGTAGTATGGTGGGAAGGPPGGMDLFRDNFEMGAGNWTATPPASWAITTDGSMVYAATGASANSTWRAGVAGETTWTDVQIDARVKITSFPGSSTSYYAGICARYQSNSMYACFALRSDGKIAFRVNGSNTNSATPPGGDIAAGTWYTVRVIARGANITAFLNGTEIAAGSRVTSGAPTSGRLALATPGTNAVFDDIVVSTP